MKSNRNLIIGGIVVFLCAVVAAGSLVGSTTQAVKFDKLAQMKGDRCEIYGSLDESSIRSIKGGNLVQFELVEDKTNQRLKVLYDNSAVSLPANFPAASHARAFGYYDAANQRFTADGVLTKCPSKYDQGSLDLARQDAIKKWQADTGMKAEGSM